MNTYIANFTAGPNTNHHKVKQSDKIQSNPTHPMDEPIRSSLIFGSDAYSFQF